MSKELSEGTIKVLNDGFIRLVDHMGGDDAIIQMARVSYGQGTKTKRDDRGLIRYLMRHWHTSPFEGVSLKFHVKAPIFVFRQWHRHRSQSINEISARYSKLPEECYLPELSRIQKQAKNNKQGSGEEMSKARQETVRLLMRISQSRQFEQYNGWLEEGMARELARINLPLATYSEMYTVMNLHNAFHFLRLRMDDHAQYEIREYANAMFELIKPICPIACEAFEDYRLNAVNFSGLEMRLLNHPQVREAVVAAARQNGIEDISMRELKEFKQKLGITEKLSS